VEPMSQPSKTDMAAVLFEQHAQIRRPFAEVEQRRGEPRREAFEQLVRLLAVHETAEQEILHPQVRLLVAGGYAIADARLEEERGRTGPRLGRRRSGDGAAPAPGHPSSSQPRSRSHSRSSASWATSILFWPIC
jgi:AcrR family transcriptional regulator